MKDITYIKHITNTNVYLQDRANDVFLAKGDVPPYNTGNKILFIRRIILLKVL